MNILDLILIAVGFFLLYGTIFAFPLPYIKIGKKIKKTSKYTMGIVGYIREKLYVSDDVVERFTWFMEEFDNFVSISYNPSFTNLYNEVSSKVKLSRIEKKHISGEINNLERRFLEVKETDRLNRKATFREAIKNFKKLVVDTSKMVKDITKIVKERPETTKLPKDFFERYKFTASEFNLYIRRFRVFLDRTHCYHDTEIEHHSLLRILLVPEELPFEGITYKI